MTRWVAFLRGINLGKRQMKMAELKACLEAAGCADVKTILASGNVRFALPGDAKAVKGLLEQRIKAEFGFPVKVILRRAESILEMVASRPFASVPCDTDATFQVIFFDHDLPDGLALEDRPGHTEVARVDSSQIYVVGYRQPNGRYTEGLEDLLKQVHAKLGTGWFDTTRNWNTIEKVLK